MTKLPLLKEALDWLPPVKIHCSNLAADALHAAIQVKKIIKVF